MDTAASRLPIGLLLAGRKKGRPEGLESGKEW
jgi:hypothetical protein